MKREPNEKPSADDASDFLSFIDSVLTKKNALLSGYVVDYDNDVREEVRSHIFYSWLASTDEFPRICPYLKKKGLARKFPESIDIYMAKCAALLYLRHCRFCANPGQLIRTTKAISKNALKHIDALTDLLNSDLQMESYSDCVDLKKLLERLKQELLGDVPTTYPRSAHGNLLGKRLVIDAHQILEILIGKAPTFVVCQLVSVVYEVTDQQVTRYTREIRKSVKTHI